MEREKIKFQFTTRHEQLLADTITPVAIYLRLRDIFPNSLLLESSEYHSRDNNISYICCQPVAGIILEDGVLSMRFPDEMQPHQKPKGTFQLREEIAAFREAFVENNTIHNNPRITPNGLFGYFTFEAVQYMEDLKLKQRAPSPRAIPTLQYHLYRYVIAIDHFHNEMHIFEHAFGEEESGLERIRHLILNKNVPEYGFSLEGEENSNMNGDEFIALVEQMKTHIYKGDVFQIVPSRAFSQKFKGDEFNVYRALRSINPSPYLFYFDYGDFKLFGSSPEAQLTIHNEKASVFPIAGTFRRSGHLEEDLAMAEKLQKDPKENAEHIMLVDLARNDLSRNCRNVTVDAYKESQYYSHVIHLVSKISAQVPAETDPFEIVADTYPAGTLSGAPKYRAIELIDHYEPSPRGFYSGAIGYMGFNRDFNHAIMIRSLMSRNNTLHYQAGAGVVADSVAELELREVDNKIAALRKAIERAVTI